jgi:hypothetical protein
MRRATCRVMFQTPYPVCECFGLMVRIRYTRAWDNRCPTPFSHQFVDDLGAGMMCYHGDPREIAAWAMGTGEGMGSEPHRLSACITQSYRIMVGTFSYGFHPDWLCVSPSPRLGHPRFPAYDRHGRQVV